MTSSDNLLDSEEVEFLLAASQQDDPAEAAPEAAESEQVVTMRGDLDQINLADIFQTLAMSRMEGVLHVHNPLEQRQVYCNEGYLRLLVPDRVIHRRIGQRLVAAHAITAEQLRSALMRQRKERIPLGELLVKDGCTTQEAIEEVLTSQVSEDLFSLFTWRHGSFDFYKGPVADVALRERLESCPEFEISSLLLEVARREDEWENILEAIHTLDEVPCTVADVPANELDNIAHTLLLDIDGATTYRQLAARAPHGLFDVSRAARDLVHGGHIANAADEHMLDVARKLGNDGAQKQAVMLLQTLREREGDRSIEVIRGIAEVLHCCGESRQAGLSLLEVAQLQTESEPAMALAREAVELAPRNAETLSFLRTTLLAHCSPDSEELAQLTLELLDALFEAERINNALEIVADARATGTADTAILLREVRLRQKSKDVPGAIAVLDELIPQLQESGDNKRLVEVCEALLRLDRARSDIRKLLARTKLSPTVRLLRLVALLVVVLLTGSMGFVYWDQSQHEQALRHAGQEITELVQIGDRVGARDRLAVWAGKLGTDAELEDLRRQIDFADAAALQRRSQAAQDRLMERLRTAGEHMLGGDLRAMFDVYTDTRQHQELRVQVDQSLSQRLETLLTEIDHAGVAMVGRLPKTPDWLLDRRSLVSELATLQELCRPELRRNFAALVAMIDEGNLPDYVAPEAREKLQQAVAAHREMFARRQYLAEAYTEALQRNNSQRAYDPVFKEALRRESRHDFAGALELFRQLEDFEAASPGLRTLFRDHVTRNATICRLIEALDEATSNGDFGVAQQQLRALEAAFPDVPFQELVRLPLRIETRPSGSNVHCNGELVGTAPSLVAYVPAQTNRIRVTHPGFRPLETQLGPDHDGVVRLRLRLLSGFEMEYAAVVDTPPATFGNTTIVVDRGGNVTCFPAMDEEPRWTFQSGDLSGLLTRITAVGDELLFGSLDGQFRALDRATGIERWSLPGLPVDTQPLHDGQFLFLATTDDRLCRIDLDQLSMQAVELPGSGDAHLAADGDRIYVATRTGLHVFSKSSLAPSWQLPLEVVGARYLAVDGNRVIAVDDGGHVGCFDSATGTERWQRVVPELIAAPPILDHGAVFVASRTTALRLAQSDGDIRREADVLETQGNGRPVRVGNRVLLPCADGEVRVLDLATAETLYALDGARRGTAILPWRSGVMIAMPDRTVRFYPTLP